MTRRPKREKHSLSPARKVRRQRPPLLIICEGQKTEPVYFTAIRQHWRLASVQVLRGGKYGSVPKKLVEQANELKTRDETLEQVWCVFDHEGQYKHPSFDEAIQLAQNYGLNTATSNPSFELWLLLHHEYTARAFMCADEALQALKKHMPKYMKGRLEFADRGFLLKHIEKALDHAGKLRKENEAHQRNCPATDVDLLVHTLKQISDIDDD